MEVDKDYYRRTALTWSLIFATFGLLSALSLLALFGVASLALKFPLSTFVAIIGLYGAATCFGLIAGNLFYRIEGQGFGIWLIGIGLAYSCLIVSTLAGSSVEFFSTHANWQDFGDYIIKPLFWVMFFGIIPAFILGLAYTAIVKKIIS